MKLLIYSDQRHTMANGRPMRRLCVWDAYSLKQGHTRHATKLVEVFTQDMVQPKYRKKPCLNESHFGYASGALHDADMHAACRCAAV